MSFRHPGPRPRPRRAAAGALATVAALLLCVALSGCTSDVNTASPPPATPGGPTPIPTDPDATPDGTAPSQTDTEWGRIWDGLPEGFPEYPGADPTETGEGPASAVFDVGEEDPGAVMDYFEQTLDAAGMSTSSLDGPREDGSWELEAVGAFVHTCRIRVTATPLGGTTIVEVLYGSDCPFD